MSRPPTPAPVAATRRLLSVRQSATLRALLDAGSALVGESGYDDLTVRAAAARAGVTHTTAYAYFSSKAHLVAEIFWSKLQSLPAPKVKPRASLPDRIVAALGAPGVLLDDQPALAQAALAALLSNDPELERVRTRIGARLAQRLGEALGPGTDPDVVESVMLAFSGAMLQAGMGYFGFEDVVARIVRMARLIER